MKDLDKDRVPSNRKTNDRRNFLRHVGAVTLAAGSVSIAPLVGSNSSVAYATPANPDTDAIGANQRAHECMKIRKDSAQAGFASTPTNLQHPTNNDETLYANKAGSYSKGLPHNSDGTVVLSAFQAMLT